MKASQPNISGAKISIAVDFKQNYSSVSKVAERVSGVEATLGVGIMRMREILSIPNDKQQ